MTQETTTTRKRNADPTLRNCYVYGYYIDFVCIYVGIGTHQSNAKYSRAKQLTNHITLMKSDYAERLDEINILIIADNLTRKSSLIIEAMMIRAMSPIDTIINISSGHRHQYIPGYRYEMSEEERKAQTANATEAITKWDAKFKLTDAYLKNYKRISNNMTRAAKRGDTAKVEKWESEMQRLRALNDEFVREQAAAKQLSVNHLFDFFL